VRGIPPEDLLIDHALRRVDSDSSSRPSGPDGPERLPAKTQIHRLGTFERYALVEATPLTGRTHQIRRHLKHASHPIIGDVRYGKGDHNRMFRERFGLHRLALHASELHVPHPTLGEVLVRARVTADLAGPLDAMGLTANC
jgi:tRNA pseudouridine65 synthase